MNSSKLKDRFAGKRFTVIHCEGAIESFQQALAKLNSGRHLKMTIALMLQIEQLANGDQMSSQNFAVEGDLPRVNGSSSGKFYALKRMPIRGYCWRSKGSPMTYYISHYINKDFPKLADEDTERVCRNWKRIEENGDER